jgi:hypothetical protein
VRASNVTNDPRPRQAVAISTPTPPAPTTANLGGTLLLSIALRLVHGLASATPGRSGTVAVLPVQMTTAWRACSVTAPSSAVVNVTRRAPSSRAWPRNSLGPMAATAAATGVSSQSVT